MVATTAGCSSDSSSTSSSGEEMDDDEVQSSKTPVRRRKKKKKKVEVMTAQGFEMLIVVPTPPPRKKQQPPLWTTLEDQDKFLPSFVEAYLEKRNLVPFEEHQPDSDIKFFLVTHTGGFQRARSAPFQAKVQIHFFGKKILCDVFLLLEWTSFLF